MRILFENEAYGQDLLDNLGLSAYAFYERGGATGMLPYVGYIYSAKANDAIFILPKVFLFHGSGDESKGEFAFGKYRINDIIEVSAKHNPLKEDGLDKILFGLSAWIYQAIDKYSIRHPKNGIVKRTTNQGVRSHNGKEDQTLIDTILSLLRFHREHSNLFTYISRIKSSGNSKIHWGKTISKVQPILQGGTPFYMEFKNKAKVVDMDEELIILFYSILQYLRQFYCFPVKPDLNYELIKPNRIDTMIESGRGTRMLLKIRRKYFEDEFVQLWKLLYTFFSHAETIRSGKCSEEALLVSSFDRVFEDMVDNLVGDDECSSLKSNDDGKEIDHIFIEKSFLEDKSIYYIGDSKYYSYNNPIDSKSIAKQFTYARNIIQINIDIFNKAESERKESDRKTCKTMRYRDPLTEGYSFTPNFFIRGYINAEDMKDGHACYGEERLVPYEQQIRINTHFGNRPFDRDTLILKAYNINFLFVLAAYVANGGDKQTKERIQRRFRSDLLVEYNKKFDFFKVTPKEAQITDFIEQNFKKFHGQMYHAEGAGFIWFAFDAETGMTEKQLSSNLNGEAEIEQVELS